jgi:IS4 transposase
VEWQRPGRIRSIDWQTLKLLPERLTIRETRVPIQQPGFRCRSMIVVSTILDAEAVSASDLAELYRARWNAELDLRSLKQTMQLDSCVARRQSWCGKKSGHTSSLTI